MIKDTGGPAFPTPFLDTDAGRTYAAQLGGMTLLDWYAGQALMGILAFPGKVQGRVCVVAYDYAEAMLAEKRNREGV